MGGVYVPLLFISLLFYSPRVSWPSTYLSVCLPTCLNSPTVFCLRNLEGLTHTDTVHLKRHFRLNRTRCCEGWGLDNTLDNTSRDSSPVETSWDLGDVPQFVDPNWVTSLFSTLQSLLFRRNRPSSLRTDPTRTGTSTLDTVEVLNNPGLGHKWKSATEW